MDGIYFLLFQVAMYGTWWLAFAAIALLMAHYLGWGGAVLGQVAIFFGVSWLDWLWLQGEMLRPGWVGLPDQDGAFAIGVVVRVVIVNTVLIGVNVIGVRMRGRGRRRDEAGGVR